ncbi:DUF2846 domain-containing protein [Salegentibacter sp. LM13S]|uniref:DUF2846 domain-containing protein n=1 Tax=Salegentibacter lacus TaxID=2873599 RepID=UPI001CCD7805|nr:DUF2846 domain-containing protein [Salegentibacter lacus]MBZ9631415.1 DUF2846 domain-containing protein [Salegentibacter lacus]
MCKLVVNRRSEWANRARKIGLYLDDQKIGAIANGEFKEFDLEPGNYKLKAKIDWCGSQLNDIEIKENELTKVELTGFSKNKWVLPILIVAQISLLILSYRIEINDFLMIAFSAGILVYIIYPISFGRNHYLKLYQVN